MSEKLGSIIEQLKSLTLLEASQLVTEIETVFGVDTSVSVAPIGAVASTVGGDTNDGGTEEKTEFDVVLTEVASDKKIAVLKVVRNVTGLGLKESKAIVDNTPKVLKESAAKEEAEGIKKDIEAAGGKVEIK
jgi:large subunit ribosomal protein L7/L12